MYVRHRSPRRDSSHVLVWWHDAHETWRKLQQELLKDSCSEESDEAVPSDEDWQEVRVRACVCVWLCGSVWFCACAWLCVFPWVHACLHTCAHDRTPTRCGVKSSSRRRIGLRRAIY